MREIAPAEMGKESSEKLHNEEQEIQRSSAEQRP